MVESSKVVCVTGGSGYIASSLIKKLLDKGHTVHATLRRLNDEVKVGVLRGLPGADTRLKLFEADLENPELFESAIKGSEIVFHLATVFHGPDSQYKDVVEGAVAGVKSIARCSISSGTVKRLIYAASVVSASPITDDSGSFKESLDEECWTPLNLSLACSSDSVKAYTDSKTPAEKECLKFGIQNGEGGGTMEVVTLPLGLVGGDTLLPYLTHCLSNFLSIITNNEVQYKELRFLEELLGKIPVVHIEDVCEAFIFCMEQASIGGRFLCASSYVQVSEIAHYLAQSYPHLLVKKEYLDGPERDIRWSGTKLIEKGFEYKYDMKMILDDTVSCARRLGHI